MSALGFRLGKLAQLHERMALDGLKVDIEARQAGILMVSASPGEWSQQAIGELLGVDRSTMVRLVDALEERGLVARARSSTDRRKRLLSPTPAGRRLIRSLRGRLQKTERALLAPLDPGEREVFTRALARLFAHWILERPLDAAPAEVDRG